MAGDPGGLAAGYGAGAANVALEELVKQALLRKQANLEQERMIANQVQFQQEQDRRRSELSQQGQQFQQQSQQQGQQFQQTYGLNARRTAVDESQNQREADLQPFTIAGLRRKQTAEDQALTDAETKRQRETAARGQVDPKLLALKDTGFNVDPQLGEKEANDLEKTRIATAAAAARQSARGMGDLNPIQAQGVFKLQDDFARDSKGFLSVRDAYQRVTASARNPNAAGDLAMIFSYMKMLDPTSVVREGEQATAQNATGVPDQVRNAYNKIMSGDRLNPEQRRQFVDRAKTLYGEASRNQKQVMDLYGRRAQKFGIDPSYVTEDYDTGASTDTGPAQASKGVLTRAAVIARGKELGLSEQEAIADATAKGYDVR